MKYVVYWCERIQDGGVEEAAKIVSSIDDGLRLAGKIKNGYAGFNMEIRLFQLGKEIPLAEDVTEESQPSIKKIQLVLKKSKRI